MLPLLPVLVAGLPSPPGPFPPDTQASRYMSNVVLAYTPGAPGMHHVWSAQEFQPLLGYQNTNQTSTTDTMFDSVWLVGTGANGKSLFPPRDRWMNNSLSLNEADWRDFLHTQIDTARALENASRAISARLSRKVTPTVAITLPCEYSTATRHSLRLQVT